MSGPGDLVAGVAVAVLLLLLPAPPVVLGQSPAPDDSLGAAGPAVLPESGAVPEREYFFLGANRRSLNLAHGDVIPGSLTIRVGGRDWLENRDFRVRARSGQVVPLRDWTAQGSVVAVAEYYFRPGGLQARVGLRPMAPPPAVDPKGVSTAAAEVEEVWQLDGAGDLDVRGSKAIYVSSGNRRELTVDQNLRLNISGQLTQDIFVRAALTDDNLPVVPEGNTEELQDIDKVLVELQATNWRATLGDFVALRRGSVFGGYRRKLQGFSLEARPGHLIAEGMFGSPRGRYRTLELRGEESNQGPYFLGVGEAGQNLFIVAGTERVTLDGELLTRGADRDYVVDYIRGTVTFTYRRLITADSIIMVEYEEGEGAYRRGVVGAGGGAVFELLDAPGEVTVRWTRERDDASRLRSGDLSPEDELVLAAAGDDPFAAVAEGATQVDPGAGDYNRITIDDTVYYEFAEAGGDWEVRFYYAGPGLGDYDLTNLTEAGVRVYTWVGPRLGTYGVGRLIPLPDSHSLVTFSADLGDSSQAGLHAEWNVSDFDHNTVSDLDGDDNVGQAVAVAGRSGARELLGGELKADAMYERRGDNFVPFLVRRTVYEYEAWGLGDRARREGFLDEAYAELGGVAAWRIGGPGAQIELVGEAASLDQGEGLAATRYGGRGRWELRGLRGRHVWRQADSRDEVDPLDILRQDQDHELSWLVGPVVPRVRWDFERWRDDARTGDSGRGFARESLTGGLAAPPGGAWRWDLSYTRGLADSLRQTEWELERDSRTWQGALTGPRFWGLRAVANATLREVIRPDGEDETTRLGRLDLGGTWTRLGSDWSLSYTLDNSRTEVLVRQLVFVGQNQGRYDENGNFVGEGRGDYELSLAGTDSLVATTAVATDLTWRQDFGFLGSERVWGAWISQTRLGVQARSRTDDIRGLLSLDRNVIFDPEDAVLGRVDLTQEVTLLRHLRQWDLRWRFEFVEGLDQQFARGREARLRRANTITTTWNPTAVMSLRLRAANDDDLRETEAELNASQLGYDALTRRIELEGAWRRVTGSRVTLAAEYLTRSDAVSGVSQVETALKPSLRWRIAETWSLQAEVRVSEVKSDEPAGVRRPYFFPSAGANVEASNRLSWDPNKYLTFALAYFARKPGGRKWQHDLRLESTARF